MIIAAVTWIEQVAPFFIQHGPDEVKRFAVPDLLVRHFWKLAHYSFALPVHAAYCDGAVVFYCHLPEWQMTSFHHWKRFYFYTVNPCKIWIQIACLIVKRSEKIAILRVVHRDYVLYIISNVGPDLRFVVIEVVDGYIEFVGFESVLEISIRHIPFLSIIIGDQDIYSTLKQFCDFFTVEAISRTKRVGVTCDHYLTAWKLKPEGVEYLVRVGIQQRFSLHGEFNSYLAEPFVQVASDASSSIKTHKFVFHVDFFSVYRMYSAETTAAITTLGQFNLNAPRLRKHYLTP
jgi:hypothetical protein